MSNKTQLQTNNTALDGYIARINAAKDVAASLPEAGGGGGANVEMCTGIVNVDAPNRDDFTVYSVNENLQTVTTTLDAMGGTFTAAKGTMFTIMPWTSVDSGVVEGCIECFYTRSGASFIVSDNFTITFMG